ncbi:hypothetical protein PV326_001053 [Microctonus aethiopoides]|nr:hypothetical protein PV326_001053 [Microctonus aethiopoides]
MSPSPHHPSETHNYHKATPTHSTMENNWASLQSSFVPADIGSSFANERPNPVSQTEFYPAYRIQDQWTNSSRQSGSLISNISVNKEMSNHITGTAAPTVRTDSNISDDNTESDEDDVQDNADNDFGVMLGLIPSFSLTETHVQFIECLAKSLRKAYEIDKKKKKNSPQITQVDDHYFSEGEEKIEISPNSGFYMNKRIVQVMESEAKLSGRGWRYLVREAIHQVYGTTIANHSATGKRSRFPHIDHRLYQGLYDWINTFNAEGTVSYTEFNDCINHCAANKRRCRKKSKIISND